MQGTFTGRADLNKIDSKFPYYSEGKTKDGGAKYHRFNLAIVDDKNNRIMTELFGMVQKEIKTMDTENNKISISWDDRDDKAIMDKVANYKKNVFSFVGDERKEFISTYDAVEYLKEHAEDLKGEKVGVTVGVSLNVYKGKISNKYEIRNIYKIDDDKKQQLKITGDFFFNKDSIDTSEWKDSQKLILNGYVQGYVAEKKATMYIPQTIVFDCSKADLKNEAHLKKVRFKLSMINCDLKDGKITSKLKNSTMYKIGVVLRYYNSAQEVEFDESMLSDKQKMAIELGFKTIEDYMRGARVFGERVVEFKLTDFQIEKQEYADGCVDLEIKTSEFEEDIFVVDEDESEDVLDGMNEPEDEDKDDDDDNGDSLFD